jgi:hypothetical protein
LNFFEELPNFGKLFLCIFTHGKNGLKTGMYYLLTKAAPDAIKFTVDADVLNQTKDEQQAVSCSLDNPEGCERCE